jgi:hypothetical protein
MTTMNLVTPKVGANRELLLNKLASEVYLTGAILGAPFLTVGDYIPFKF